MKYKALFLDVDGTTVVHGVDNLPSPRVTEAIHKCKDKGISVCLATSRTLRVTHKIIEHLDLSGYCVLSSGTQIYDPVKKKIIIEKKLPDDAIATILAVAKKYKQECKIFDGKKEIAAEKIHSTEVVVGIYFPQLKFSIFEKIHKELSSVSSISLHRMPAWDKRFECLDVISKDASKLHGISEVAELLKIHTHEMIGVGDGYNDFPLLMACGLKIAMGNGVPELKAIADFIAPSVEDDGIATVIEKFILHE
jgi:hypothetical protein